MHDKMKLITSGFTFLDGILMKIYNVKAASVLPSVSAIKPFSGLS